MEKEKDMLPENYRRLIIAHFGNITRFAKIIGINRQVIYRRGKGKAPITPEMMLALEAAIARKNSN